MKIGSLAKNLAIVAICNTINATIVGSAYATGNLIRIIQMENNTREIRKLLEEIKDLAANDIHRQTNH